MNQPEDYDASYRTLAAVLGLEGLLDDCPVCGGQGWTGELGNIDPDTGYPKLEQKLCNPCWGEGKKLPPVAERLHRLVKTAKARGDTVTFYPDGNVLLHSVGRFEAPEAWCALTEACLAATGEAMTPEQLCTICGKSFPPGSGHILCLEHGTVAP